MKRMIAVIMTVIMLFSVLPISTYAEISDTTEFLVDSVDAFPGDTVSVNVKIKNNPGIVSANINVAFDENLTLVGATKGDVFPATMSYIPPKQLSTIGRISSSCNFAWSGTDIDDKDIKDGTLVTLKFEVSQEAQIGDEYKITVSARKSDIVDKNAQPINLASKTGIISIIDYKPGDVNDDGDITMLDTVLINRYIVDGCKYDPDGYAIEINENAANVNDDDSVTMLDVLLINRYIVDDCQTIQPPEGYGVELKHVTKKCVHALESVEAVAATCTEDGNIAYWHCTKCGKYYADESGNTVVTLSDTIITATGHSPVVDSYVEPTETTEGLTEGSHCSKCLTVLVPQKSIPPIEAKKYNIVYHLWDNDTDYLKTVDLENTNPVSQNCSKALRLQPLDDEGLGFNFKGWFILGEEKPTNTIDANTIEDGGTIHLYAKWEKVKYKIQFDSDLKPVEDGTYTVDETKVLPTPELDGYVFVGWSDEDGNIIRRIPQGETDEKIYVANWLSERNQAWTKKTLGDPIIYEDDENNQIIFAYEIGEIRNVPVQVIHNFGKINSSGVTKTETKEFTKKISATEMTNYTSTVSKATTESFGWTLSNGWSDEITANREWCEENGLTEQEAKELCTNDTNGWYVSSGDSGYDTTTTYGSTDTHDLETTTNNTKTYGNTTTEKRKDFSAELDIKAKENLKIVEKIGPQLELEEEVDLKYSNGRTTKEQTGQDIDNGDGSEEGTITKTGSDTVHNETWNHESGSNASHSVTETESIIKEVSRRTSEKTGYGESYIKNGNEQSSENISNQTSSSDSYGGSVTFSTEESEKITKTFTTENTVSGYHRWILASTAHVFAAVGYDIETSSYYVFNYTIMDDKTFEYEDYSYNDSNYQDNQSGVLSFEVPTDIKSYVKERVVGSDGLEVSRDGKVTGYTGTDDFVIIPEYQVIDGPSGASVVKVTAIDQKAFSNRDDIVAVELSDFIHELPDYAFNNCTELQHITAKEFSKIGSHAFDGCSKLTYASINANVSEIGDCVFGGIKDLAVEAANKSIVEKVLNSGAENILLVIDEKCNDLTNTTLKIPSSVNSFIFDGSSKVFKDVILQSDAPDTTIRNAEFVSTGKTPLELKSSNISLQEIKASAPGIAMALTATDASVSLFGESFVTTANENAMLCKSVVLDKIDSNLFSQLHISGNVLVCDEESDVVSNGYLDVDNGKIISINEDEFAMYLKGTIKVIFNAEGGSVDTTSKTAYFGTEIGELPVPTKDYHDFDGWYTDDGEKYNENTIITSASDIELHARWIEKGVEGWIEASKLPENAQVVNRKYSYTLREYTSNGNSLLEGWVKYDTQRTGWGSTQGPVYSDPNNGSRNVWTESYISGYNTKHIWRFYKWGYNSTDYSYSYNPGGGRSYLVVDVDYWPSATSQRPVSKDGGTYKWWTGSSWSSVWYESERDEPNYDSPIWATRWYYQEPIYTYFYYRDLLKESESDPSDQENVSNVQEWVMYREK